VRALDLFLVVSIVLAALGVGLSWTGYSASSEIVTVTTTESTSVASTMATATRTESSVVWTTSTQSVHDVFTIRGEQPGAYCAYAYGYLPSKVGKLHISYTSVAARPEPSGALASGPSFFLYVTSVGGSSSYRGGVSSGPCSVVNNPPHQFSIRRESYEMTIDVTSDGDAYIHFVNHMQDSVTVTLDAWEELAPTQVTVTQYRTLWTTKWVPTQVVRVVSEPAGLGVTFFLGVALVLGGISVATISRVKGSSETRGKPAALKSPETVGIARPAPASTMFCYDCGARIPRGSVYCQECGARL